jgi:hypothetical protein
MADVQISFGATIEQFLQGVEGIKNGVEGVKADIESVAELATAGFGAEKLIEYGVQMGELGERTQRMSEMLGVSTEEIGRLDAIAGATGTSTDMLARSVEIFQTNLAKARSGTGPAAEALRAFGLSAKDFVDVPIDQQLNKLADAVSKFADGGNKLAAVRALLGRGGDELIPLLDKGSAGLAEAAAMADRAGTAMSTATTEGLENMKQGFVELGLSTKGVGITFITELEPAINGAVRSLIDFVEWVNGALKSSTTLSTALSVIKGAADGVAISIDAVVFSIEGLVQIADLALKEIGDALSGNTGKAMSDLKSFNASMETEEKAFFDRLKTIIGEGSEAATSTISKPAAGALGGGGEAKALLKGYQDSIKADEEYYKSATEHLNALAKLGVISESQKTTSLLAEVSKREEAELHWLDKELQTGNLSVQQRRAIEDQKTQIVQKAAADQQKIHDQAAEQEKKTIDAGATAVLGAWNSQLKGLLSGTETFGQAMTNIFSQMVMKIIEYLEKVVVEQLVVKGLQVAIFGPAGIALPSFDVGTNYVANTGLAMVHAGEAIVPAQGTGPYSGGGGQGGGSMVFAPNFSGFIGTQAMINQIMPQLARSLQSYNNANPSTA